MDLIFEFIIELLFDAVGTGISDASRSSRIPKPIRCILLILILLFWIAFYILIFFVGFLLLQKNIFAGILMLALGAFMLFFTIRKLKIQYSKKQ